MRSGAVSSHTGAGMMSEVCLLPTVPLVDAHHHLFPSPRNPPKKRKDKLDPPTIAERTFGRYVGRTATSVGYEARRLLLDAKGCNVVATVHVEAGSRYDKSVKSHMAPVGESR